MVEPGEELKLVFDKAITLPEINQIYKDSAKKSLLNNFGKYKSSKSLKTYYDFRHYRKDKLIDINTIQASTLVTLQQKFKSYLEDIFGLLPINEITNSKLNEVMNLIIEIKRGKR